jgi:hypothetical protein
MIAAAKSRSKWLGGRACERFRPAPWLGTTGARHGDTGNLRTRSSRHWTTPRRPEVLEKSFITMVGVVGCSDLQGSPISRISCVHCVCVFITAVPITKLLAWGGSDVEAGDSL